MLSALRQIANHLFEIYFIVFSVILFNIQPDALVMLMVLAVLAALLLDTVSILDAYRRLRVLLKVKNLEEISPHLYKYLKHEESPLNSLSLELLKTYKEEIKILQGKEVYDVLILEQSLIEKDTAARPQTVWDKYPL